MEIAAAGISRDCGGGFTGAKFVFLTTAIANLNFDTIDKCIDAHVMITATLFLSSFFFRSFSWVVLSMLASRIRLPERAMGSRRVA